MDTPKAPNATAAAGDLSADERRRLRFCVAAAWLSPAVVACASFAVLRIAWAIGGPRMRMTPSGQTFWTVYEKGILPGGAVIGAALVAAAVIRLHPAPGGRVRIAVRWGLASLLVYIAAYVVVERLWSAVRY